MSLLRSWLLVPVTALALAAALPACGGSSKYYVPVDSQMKPFTKPDADDLVSSDDDSYDDASGDQGDWGSSDTTPAPDNKTPAPASGTPAPGAKPGAAPGSKPAATPGKPAKPAKSAKPAKPAKSAKHAKHAKSARAGAGAATK